MKAALLTLTTFLCLTSCTPDGANKQKLNETTPTIRILFTKIRAGEYNSTIIDTQGNTQPLTFGTFISVATEAMLGKKLINCNVKRGDTIYIYRDGSQIYFNYGQGQQPFSLDVLLNALSASLKNCDGSSGVQSQASLKGVQIFFEKEKRGALEAYIVHPDGRKELLNLGNLLCACAELMNDCSIMADDTHFLSIMFSVENGKMKTVLVDAQGNMMDLSLNNLVMAAVNTLVSCKGTPLPAMVMPVKTDPGATLKVFFSKKGRGNLQAYVVDTRGRMRDLNLGTLLDSAIDTKPCTATTPRMYLDLSFLKANNNFKITITDPTGATQDLELLQGLVTFASEFCQQN